ncbi:GAF domain-containing protein, partial [Modestobacter sp. NPDC049651]|uniref:GAF domain-containing protein n=1 Tax=Modestobacter sp. NPDC049651 TaxID=3155777 RepID=UPI0033F474CB
MRRRSTTGTAGPAAPGVPRDVEAVEAVVDALERGVDDETAAHGLITETLVRELGLDYGAVWLPAGNGSFCLAGEYGPLVGAVAATVAGRVATMTAADGYGGEALRTERAVLVDGTSDTAGCARWAGASAAGATAGCFLPLVEDGRVSAVYEYYDDGALPFVGQRRGKWESLGRLLTHARRSALATTALRQTLDDRQAVTSVVTEIGAAGTAEHALRIALDTVRTAFGWAYGSYWALDTSDNLLK